ncbi:MAG: hypothetical protein R3Y12_08855 [Clostridia bacterium]
MITNYPTFFDAENIQNKEMSVVFTGGISSEWNHINIIKALQNTSAKYNLCGRGSSDYIESIKALDKGSHLCYLGEISHKKALEVQCQSLVGIAVAKYNMNVGGKTGTLGNTKIFEYMMSGLPIISIPLS